MNIGTFFGGIIELIAATWILIVFFLTKEEYDDLRKFKIFIIIMTIIFYILGFAFIIWSFY